LKLNNELFDHLPNHLKQKLVEKISQKKGVTNKDALEIMRRFGGN
jgi:NaMN:DMB phosphoribosyltransferase